ncbi:MAG: hypothetical protein KDK25_04920 [Leptospiraceae bacterium]|nr:hypothetical protein [Leptospiraceae bacterium]
MPYSSRNILAGSALALLLAAPLFAEPSDGFPVPGVPYGLAHDGEYFWFTELTGRKLYRADSKGRIQAYFYGNRYLYGIRFSPYDGYIYAGSRNCFYRYSPVTGKQLDRLSVPVDRVAGLAFGPGVIYLLEKGSGKVHVYSPDSGRILYSGSTGLKKARDIAFYRGQIWITEGDTGLIHRFDPDGFRPTGSLEAPSQTLRGLAFVKGELWILDRDRLRLEPVFFSEGPNFIAGQEKNHSLVYRISWKELKDRALVVVLPASGRGQRVGSPQLSGKYQITYLADGTRVVLIRSATSGASGAVEFRIPISLRSVHYLFQKSEAPEKKEKKGCYVPVAQGLIQTNALNCRTLYQRGREPTIPGPPGIVDGGRSVEFLDSVRDLELLRIPPDIRPGVVYSVGRFDPSMSLDDLTPENTPTEIYMELEK